MTVYLVGAGPGAPDLLTVRAFRLLEKADVVLHDALVHPDTLALAARARRVAVGKRCGGPATDQSVIHRLMIEYAATCDIVVRLKGGDPMLFARAQEEIDALRVAGVECEVVPGITAASAASAALGIPLTRRGDVRNIALVTPERAGEGFDADEMRVAASADAGAIYMGGRESGKVAAALIASGKPLATPVVLVQNASLPTQQSRFTTLARLAGERPASPSVPTVILFGPQFRRELPWDGRLPRSTTDSPAHVAPRSNDLLAIA
jgi:uroporphyrin-III C-methyltransferase